VLVTVVVVVSSLLQVEASLLAVSLILNISLVDMAAQVLSREGDGMLTIVLLLEVHLAAGGVVSSVELV
jgi:hypothetical protein